MRTIFYASNMQSSLFPLNSRSSFQTYIHPQDLSYISNDNIEAAIKSITFDNEYESYLHGEQTLALKTNLSFETISSYGWDKIISIFNINTKNKGICQIEFKNPTFFSTNLYNLCRASFNIVNIETGNDPKFTTGSPTFIEVVVKSQAKRMKTPFHMLLDSSCGESMKRFPNNTNMEFCIQLPQRMEFQKDWMLCLKSIHFSNKFSTLQQCSISISGMKTSGTKWKIEGGLGKKVRHELSTVLKHLNRITRGFLHFTSDANNAVLIQCNTSYDSTTYGDEMEVEFSKDLIQILGLRSNQPKTIFTKSTTLLGPHQANIFALHPHHFIVCCDLVEESILGGQHVQILKYFPKKHTTDNRVDREFTNNDFVKLNLKNFDRIHIRIADISGKTIECDPDIPTRMQFLFVNTNSQ